MTTFSPIASIWSLANAISSIVAAAVAGSTRPTVSPGARRLGFFAGERGLASGGAGEAADAAPIDAAAAVSETRRANSRRSMAGKCTKVVGDQLSRIGPSGESRQRAKE